MAHLVFFDKDNLAVSICDRDGDIPQLGSLVRLKTVRSGAFGENRTITEGIVNDLETTYEYRPQEREFYRSYQTTNVYLVQVREEK